MEFPTRLLCKTAFSKRTLMSFLCVFSVFCTSSNACYFNYNCRYPEEKCCHQFNPPKCILSSSLKCDVTPRPTTPTIATKSPDDDDASISVLAPAVIGTVSILGMCWIACAVSRRKLTTRQQQLQERYRSEQFARLTSTEQQAHQSSRPSSTNDVTIHVVAPMRPTAPDLSQISSQSNHDSYLLSNFNEVQPERFRDAPPMYADVVGTDNLPPPPKYEEVV